MMTIRVQEKETRGAETVLIPTDVEISPAELKTGVDAATGVVKTFVKIPGAVTDDALVRWNGATGELVQNSSATLTDAGKLTTSTVKLTGGAPGAGKVLTSDAGGDATWEVAAGGGWVDDGTVVRLSTSTDKVGIGTTSPQAQLEVGGTPGASVGGFASGNLHVTGQSALVNANAVVTGHNLFGGNKQLWYLGSTSSSTDNVGFINRQTGSMIFSTSNATRMTIESDGTIGIGGAPTGSAILELISTTKGFLPPKLTTVQIDAIDTPATGLLVFDTTEELLRIRKAGAWCHVPCGVVTGQFSDSTDQLPTVTTPVVITFNTNDIVLKGLSHSTTVNPEEFTADVSKSFTFMLAPQHTHDSAGETIDFFIMLDTGGGFANVANSNIKIKTPAAGSNVSPLMYTINMAVGDKVRFMQKISSTVAILGIDATAAAGGVPATPSVILTVFSGD